jgi:copper homeostasis protein CutC
MQILSEDVGNKQKHTRHLGEDYRYGLVETAYKCMILAHDSEFNYVKALDKVYTLDIRDIVTSGSVKLHIENVAKSFSLLTGTKMSPLREALSSGGNTPAEEKHPFSEP